MIRFSLRRLTATMLLAASASVVAFASQAPTEAPPKPYEVPKGAKDYIRNAVQSPDRPAAMTAHDFYRKPAELLAAAGVKPGSRVIELDSYGNYYSTLLSSVVGEKGELHMYDLPFFGDQYAKYEKAFTEKHPNSTYEDVDFNKAEFPKNTDVVMCVLCFHEMLLTGVDMTSFHAKLYKAMKPGGTYIIVFYVARDGTETDDTGKLHRIDPQSVRATVQAAGFTLYQEDRYLENHDDDHTWAVETEAQGDIADRTVYKFRK